MTTSHARSGNALRLSVMMFFQYAVWGAWLPVASRYITADPELGGLGFSNQQMGWILGLGGSIGAISAPFIAGQIADRYFRAERFLALLMLAGGVINWLLASQASYPVWLGLSIAYSVVFMPTLALSNSIAFAHLADTDRDFPRVRVWGTIGWIAASWIFPMVWLQRDLSLGWMPPFLTGPEVGGVVGELANALRFSGGLAIAYALYCLTLPATPPKPDASSSLAFAAAFGLFRRKSLFVLLVAALAISVIHNIYFLQAPNFFPAIGLETSEIGPAMTIGQFSEIAVMAVLGRMLMGLGVRNVLMAGAMAYFLRYGIWAMDAFPAWVHVSSQALHGVCYACFFATAFIYVDRIAPKEIQHSAQTVFGIIILGGGPLLGGWFQGQFATDGEAGFSPLWTTLSLIGLATTVFLFFLFRDESKGVDPTVPDHEAEAMVQEFG